MIKRKLVMGAAIIATSMMLSGCGGSSPEDTVTDYIDAWNSGDLKGVISYTDNDLSKQIQNNIDYCIENKMATHIDKKFDLYMDEVNKMWKTNNPFEAIKKSEKPKDGIEELERIVKDNSLTAEEKTEKIGMHTFAYIDSYKNVKSEMSPVAYKMLAFMFSNKMRAMSGDFFGAIDKYGRNEYFKKLVLDDMRKSGDDSIAKSQKTCEAELFKPDSIESINVIEVKEESPDRKTVRVELVKKSDSVKKAIRVELVNKKWVVTTVL